MDPEIEEEQNQPSEESESQDYTFSWDCFRTKFNSADPINKKAFTEEMERQESLELSKHSSCMQKLGIIIAFSSLILVETVLKIKGSSVNLVELSNFLYLVGIFILFLCSFIGTVGMISNNAFPQLGMHIWDLEDKISTESNNLEKNIEYQRIIYLDALYSSNNKIRDMIVRVGILLILGLLFIILSVMTGVNWI